VTAIDHPPTTDRARIQEALRQSRIMTLATTNIDGSPWATPVGYQADDDLKLHFSSLMGARHVHNLLADDRVSVAIYGLDDDVAIGLQITGRAKLTTNGGEGWQRFTVTPNEIWYHDSRIDHDRHRLDAPRGSTSR
jgi:general stress protein 26